MMGGQNWRLCSSQTNWKQNADWECWKKLEEQFKQIHGPFLFDLDEDDQDKAC
jgi:hypothetical protein